MRGLKQWLGHAVIVSADGFDVKGVLEQVQGGVLVLVGAASLSSDGRETPIDGSLAVNLNLVRYVQVP